MVIPEGGNVDWEVEVVAVIGRRAERVAAAVAWSYVAGLMAGQDISERVTQLRGPAPQFSLGKSFPGFAPVGPWVVTVEEFADPDDLELRCAVDGEIVQLGRTRDFVFGVPRLIEGLSRVTPLLPGDIIFCGTPPGVGVGRDPKRLLQPGEELVSHVEGIGELRQKFAAALPAGSGPILPFTDNSSLLPGRDDPRGDASPLPGPFKEEKTANASTPSDIDHHRRAEPAGDRRVLPGLRFAAGRR